jgi:hypothetical protein
MPFYHTPSQCQATDRIGNCVTLSEPSMAAHKWIGVKTSPRLPLAPLGAPKKTCERGVTVPPSRASHGRRRVHIKAVKRTWIYVQFRGHPLTH